MTSRMFAAALLCYLCAPASGVLIGQVSTQKPIYLDSVASIKDRVSDLLGRMTLQEKIAQLQCTSQYPSDKSQMPRDGIGQMATVLRRYSPSDGARMANAVHSLVQDKTRLKIPVIIHDEGLHGLVASGATSFPQAIGLASTFDTTLMGEVATVIAQEARSRGIRQLLSPVINIARDVRWGRVEETYGEDPFLSSRMGVAFCSSLEREGVIATPKHFVANVGDDSLRNEKVKVLSALREIAPEHSRRSTVRAQYAGYTREEGVDPHSTTETFAALQLYVDNWRWQGVPFYLRSGKKMQEKTSEIIIQFRRPPTQIFDVQAGVTELFTNHLAICIQPDEGMHLRFITKVPDQGMHTRPVDMAFHFRDSFGIDAIPEAYERLLLDALQGDASLFTRSDEIELAWRFVDGIRAGWDDPDGSPLLEYAQGSWGPEASDVLLWGGGRWWRHECSPHTGPPGSAQGGQ